MWFYHDNCWQKIVEYLPQRPGAVRYYQGDKKSMARECEAYAKQVDLYRFMRDPVPYTLGELSAMEQAMLPSKG